MGHTLPLRAVKGQWSKGLLSRAVSSKIDCVPCVERKDTRRFRESLTSAVRIGRLNCDTKGKVDVESDDFHRYFLNVID